MAAEKSFEEKLKKWLESEGIYPLGTPKQNMLVKPYGYWEKRWGGGKYTKAGLPDMHIVVNGISIEVELKAPRGRVSELQKHNINQIDNAGCIALVLFPKDFENFKKLVLFIKNNYRIHRDMIAYSGLERGWKDDKR